MINFSRRGFLAAGAAGLGLAAMPRMPVAQTAPLSLTATTRVLDIQGRAATVLGLGKGLVLEPGQRFRVDLRNDLDQPTLIHWHGQTPPNAQDGVPDMPMPMLAPGESRSYDFDPVPGTHWMHAHVPLQEIRLLAAPLIVRSAGDVAADRQEVVMFLHDFAFAEPQEVIERITGGHAPAADAGHGMGHGMHGGENSGGMNMGKMDMGGMAMDLNDYDWDAYLTNDRTLHDPEIVSVDGGGRVLLRIINAASATVFWIDTAELPGQLVAVDGHGTQPVAGSRFGVAMGQRLDILIDLPAGGAWPILALREGARERTGLILATPGAAIPKIPLMSEADSPAFDTDLSQEAGFAALDPLSARRTDRTHMVMLGGSMQPYLWTIDGKTWGDHTPVEARTGERVELMFHNMSMMGHPIHLHGHSFQVVGINGTRLSGARRDTVYVPPMAMVTVALDAGEAARWMLHCHHVPHMATGMMTEFAVS
ncbi:multicopper oxidase family protein [Paracoccus sp. (in: a-proteobacteria)]|uniref:multicopper oxidase family protein n=1 Tax=Paracoccus sp. TaxID=267 RepID=UPI003A865225